MAELFLNSAVETALKSLKMMAALILGGETKKLPYTCTKRSYNCLSLCLSLAVKILSVFLKNGSCVFQFFPLIRLFCSECSYYGYKTNPIFTLPSPRHCLAFVYVFNSEQEIWQDKIRVVPVSSLFICSLTALLSPMRFSVTSVPTLA